MNAQRTYPYTASKAHKFGVRLRLDLMKWTGRFSPREEGEATQRGVSRCWSEAASGVLGLTADEITARKTVKVLSTSVYVKRNGQWTRAV